MNRRVSVIVTCYNHEEYIEECLQSIFIQTYSNIDLYVYNDGSTDRSGDLIQETLQYSPFAKTTYVEQENRGLVATRNRALKSIDGDYFLFVDSDNYLEPNYVEVLLQAAEDEGADIVYTRLFDPDSGQIVLEPKEFDLQSFYIENFIDSCSLVRRSKAEGLFYDPWLNHKKLEDYEFFFHLIVVREAKAFPVKETHLNYRVLENSMSARNDYRKHYQAYAYILGKYYQANPDLAEVALKENFTRFGQLVDLEALYDQEVITIYRDEGLGFQESNKEILALEKDGEIQVEISEKDLQLRIDFSEIPIYLSVLEIMSDGRPVKVTSTNGIIISKGWIFPSKDPQITVNTQGLKASMIQIRYRRMVLGDLNSNEFASRLLANEIQNLQVSLANIEKSLLQKTEEYSELKTNFDAVVNSRRWIWTSRLISFFRRKK